MLTKARQGKKAMESRRSFPWSGSLLPARSQCITLQGWRQQKSVFGIAKQNSGSISLESSNNFY